MQIFNVRSDVFICLFENFIMPSINHTPEGHTVPVFGAGVETTMFQLMFCFECNYLVSIRPAKSSGATQPAILLQNRFYLIQLVVTELQIIQRREVIFELFDAARAD